MRKDIKKLVSYYVRKYNTRNPFELAQYLNVHIASGDMGSRAGCYMFLKNHRCIFLNDDLEDNEKLLVMAHELGHAIMHRKENCYFIRNKTSLLNSKIENEANKFAMELLISDEFLEEYSHCTIDQLSRMTGYHRKLFELRLQ